MDIQVESAGGLARRLVVNIPAERVDSAVEERMKRLAALIRVPGFRPGKAPMKVIRQQYGESARAEVITDLVRETYPQALDQANVRPASAPQFEIQTEQAGAPLAYVASFEVFPEIRLDAIPSLAIRKPIVDVTEADVDLLVDNLRNARRTWIAVERPAQSGDQAVVDFDGQVDGSSFAGGEGRDTAIELGAGQYLADLENGIVGHSAGERFDVPVQFPETYQSPDLRGKAALFAVELKAVREAQMPEMNGEFLKSHGVEEEAGEAGLRNKCRAALEAERDKAIRVKIKQQVLDGLLAAFPVDVPSAPVAEEAARLRQDTASRMGLGAEGQGTGAAKVMADRLDKMLPIALFEPQARRRVALGLLLSEAVNARGIALDFKRVDAMLDEIAGDYESPDEVRSYYRSQSQMMQNLRTSVLEEQLVESLVADATLTDDPMPLQALLNPQAST